SVFGIVLLFISNIMYNKPSFANRVRISQAIAGAAIADLYFCAFAASSLYHLIPEWLSLIFTALITFCAIVISLRSC
ncbi:MAG: DUF2339 domain-containing protein, partial [Pseudomonadota bacterium]